MFSVTVSNELPALKTLTGSLTQHLKSEGLSETLANNLLVIVEELFVNFVDHGGRADGSFELRVDRHKERTIVRVADDGIPFNPLECPHADTKATLEERDVGGLGLHLVRQFAAGLTYRRENDRNVIEFEMIE